MKELNIDNIKVKNIFIYLKADLTALNMWGLHNMAQDLLRHIHAHFQKETEF